MKIDKNPNLNQNNISFILQGPFIPEVTSKAIFQIKKVFEHSPIILSTWEGTSLPTLPVDKIIFSPDPGGPFQDKDNLIRNNLTRQVISTRIALRTIKTKYVLKLRTDIILKNNNFLKYLKAYPLRNNQFSVFKEKILISSIFTKINFEDNTGRYPPPILHLSDWILFGLTEDLLNLFFNTELPIEPKFSRYFEFNSTRRYEERFLAKFPCEQQLYLSFFKKYFKDFNLINDYTQSTKEFFDLSKKIILSNFIIVDPTNWKFTLEKKYYSRISRSNLFIGDSTFKTLYREFLYKEDYNNYFNIKGSKFDIEKFLHYAMPQVILSKILSFFYKELQ